MRVALPWETIVIGGGPGGATVATYLARAGRRVLLLEKEHFPRFHIGESLLPYNRVIFEEMGVLPAIEAAGFPTKVGAQFHLGNGTKSTRFVFREGRFTREPQAFQVERAVFDHLLLQHARTSGAEVREGWTVTQVANGPDDVRVAATGGAGPGEELRAEYVVDASGRANLTGTQQGLRELHPRLKKLAVFGHFTGVHRDTGERGGDTVIVRLENKWFWLIPIAPDRTSVGCVLDRDEYAAQPGAPAEVFARLVAASRRLRDWMAGAQPVGPIQTTSDFSYHNRTFVGPRLLRVGDAAGFMDPIFSAGVYLAMYSGRLAARTLLETNGRNATRRFAAYEKRVRRAMEFYWAMVERYYTQPFMELFLEPRHRLEIPAAVNAILAGELEGGWALRWRWRLFFWLIRVQARFPLVPRISFAEPAG